MNSKTQPGIAGTVRGRLIRGFGATALGPIVTAIVQIVSVPIFLHFWGAKLYGEWLVISAIPIYLALSDIGFGSVAGNDMTMRVAAGDREGALETFQSTWVLIGVTSLLVEIAVLGAIWFLPLTRWLNLSSVGLAEVRLVLIILSVYAIFAVQAGLVMSGFRSDGNFALSTVMYSVVRLAEWIMATIAVALGAGPLRVAGALLVARILGTFVMGWLMVRKSPWLRFGFRHARFSSVQRLAPLAVAFMAFPVGSALSVQGMVVVVGIVLGPVAVATFSTMRTLTRLGFQIMETIKNSVWPELSAAYGAQNWNLARKLHRTACQASLWLSILAVVFLFIAGGRIVTVWSHGRIVMDVSAFRWLLLVVVANSFWNTSSVATMASNKHQRIAAAYFAATAAATVVAYLLLPRFGLSGAAMALLIVDITVGWFVVKSSLMELDEGLRQFLKALLRVPDGLQRL